MRKIEHISDASNRNKNVDIINNNVPTQSSDTYKPHYSDISEADDVQTQLNPSESNPEQVGEVSTESPGALVTQAINSFSNMSAFKKCRKSSTGSATKRLHSGGKSTYDSDVTGKVRTFRYLTDNLRNMEKHLEKMKVRRLLAKQNLKDLGVPDNILEDDTDYQFAFISVNSDEAKTGVDETEIGLDESEIGLDESEIDVAKVGSSKGMNKGGTNQNLFILGSDDAHDSSLIEIEPNPNFVSPQRIKKEKPEIVEPIVIGSSDEDDDIVLM